MNRINWETKKLEDLCEYISRGISPKYTDNSGTTILNQKCIRNHQINYDESRIHDEVSKKFDKQKLIQIGDILVNSTGTGTLGRVAQVKQVNHPTLVDSHITIVRPKNGLFDSNFFGWGMVYIEDIIKELGAGASGQTELPRETLKNLEITYPESISEQQRIVKILDEIFENVAKAKENAERNLENVTFFHNSYLQNVLFNKSNDWYEILLGDTSFFKIIDGDRGKNYPNKTDFSKNGYCIFLNTKNVRPDGFDFQSTSFISSEKDATLGNGKLKYGDVILTTRGTIGNTAVYDERVPYKNMRINSGMLIFRLNTNLIIPDYLFALFKSNLVTQQIKDNVSGAAQPQLPIKTLVNFKIPVPYTVSEQRSIVNAITDLTLKTKKLEFIYQQKLANLEELKKSVLKKAFAGEL